MSFSINQGKIGPEKIVEQFNECEKLILSMPKTATPTYYCEAYAQNYVANCPATLEKIFPDKYFSSFVKLEIVSAILAINEWKMKTNN